MRQIIGRLAAAIVSSAALADTITVVTSLPKELTTACKHGLRAALGVLLAAVAIPTAATVIPLEGVTPQRVPALTPFAPIAVRVLDDAGAPVADTALNLSAFYPLSPVPGSTTCNLDFMIVWNCGARTDAAGVATFPALRGEYAGSYTAIVRPASAALGSAQLQFVVDPRSAPATLEVVGGTGQSAVIGTPLAQPFTVRVRHADGAPVPGAHVYPLQTGAAGGASFAPISGQSYVVADSEGRAQLPAARAGWGTGVAELGALYVDDEARVRVSLSLPFTVTNAQGGEHLDFQALWWSGLAENGWGMSVVQHERQLFNVLFVYDAAGNPTWYVQPGGRWIDDLLGGQFTAPIYQPRGAPWFDYDRARFVVGPEAGRIMLMYRGEQQGWASFAINLANGGSFNFGREIVRQDFRPSTPTASKGLADMWWGGEQQNGWGMAIHEQEGGLFIVWFTYDASGMPTWFVMSSGIWRDESTYEGIIHRTTGSPWTNGTYDASRLQVVPVGTFSMRFAGRDRATFEYRLEGRTGQLAIERQPF